MYNWESKIPINQIVEIRAKTTVFFGIGAIEKIDFIAETYKARGIKKILVVASASAYKKTGAWDYCEKAFNKHGIEYVVYNKITPNPTTDSCDEAKEIALKFGAQAVVGIGGGSPIDSAKSIAILLAYPEKTCRDLYEFTFSPEKALPVVAINLTHGTGTECNRFAVVTIPEKNYKPAIAYDCIYPDFSIDDPRLTAFLPGYQTLYTSIDAVNHIIEAATSKAASPYTIMLARETVHLISKYLPQAMAHPDDLTARYYLLYASLIAGIAFDNGLLHFTHALEHPLSAVKPDLTHGLGLAIILPAIIKQIYPAKAEVLADILAPVVPDLTGIPAEAEKAAKGVESWMYHLGVTSKLTQEGFTENDVGKLTDLSFTTPSLDLLLSMAPIEATKEVVESIYRDSLNFK